MTHTARIATKLFLHKQTCFSLRDLAWALSIYTMQGYDSGSDRQMTLFWSCVLDQKGQASWFFGRVQGGGKPVAIPKPTLVHWITLRLRQELAVLPEPAVELLCAFAKSELVAGAFLPNIKWDKSKPKHAASSPSTSSPAFPLGYELSGAAKARCLQHCTSSPAPCI